MLYTRFVRRHACTAEAIKYPGVLVQLGDVVCRLLAIFKQLRRIGFGAVNYLGKGTYARFPRIFPILSFKRHLRLQVAPRDLLSPVLANQGANVDLEMTSCLASCVVGVFGAKACHKHLCGCLVPRMRGRSVQVKFEIVLRAREFIAQWVVSVCLVFVDLLLECAILWDVQQQRGVFPDIILDDCQSQIRRT